MDKKFAKWYRQRYEEISAEPPEGLWDDLRSSLDEKRRQERKRLGAWLFSSGGALLVTGVIWMALLANGVDNGEGFSSLNFHFPQIHANSSNTRSALALVTETSDKTRRSSQSPKEIVTSRVETRAAREDENSHLLFSSAAGVSEEGAAAAQQAAGNESSSADELSSLQPTHAEISQPLPALPFNGHILPTLNDPAQPITKAPKFYFGITANYHNAWVVNSNLWSAAQKNSLNYITPYYSSSASLLTGYSLTKRKKLFAEIGTYRMGQRYSSYEEGHRSQYELTLRYANMNLFFSMSSRSHTKGSIESWLAWQAGLHAGYLFAATENRGERASSILDDYKRVNAGLLIGGSYNALWKKRIGLAAGIRGQLGLVNVYSGCEEMPLSLNKTFNESFSLFTSLYYAF